MTHSCRSGRLARSLLNALRPRTGCCSVPRTTCCSFEGHVEPSLVTIVNGSYEPLDSAMATSALGRGESSALAGSCRSRRDTARWRRDGRCATVRRGHGAPATVPRVGLMVVSVSPPHSPDRQFPLHKHHSKFGGQQKAGQRHSRSAAWAAASIITGQSTGGGVYGGSTSERRLFRPHSSRPHSKGEIELATLPVHWLPAGSG